MATNTPNLTQDSFLMYIQDPEQRLTDIYWESCSGIGMAAEVIQTSNGRKRYQMASRPVPQEFTLSKGANPDEDPILDYWLQNHCSAKNVNFDGLVGDGAIFILIPLKPCISSEPYAKTMKVYNIIPIAWTGWNADLLATTDVSRFEVTFNYSRYSLE